MFNWLSGVKSALDILCFFKCAKPKKVDELRVLKKELLDLVEAYKILQMKGREYND